MKTLEVKDNWEKGAICFSHQLGNNRQFASSIHLNFENFHLITKEPGFPRFAKIYPSKIYANCYFTTSHASHD